MESNVYETNDTLGAVHKLHRQERGRRGKVCQMPIVLHKFMRLSVVQRQAKCLNVVGSRAFLQS